MVARAVVMTRSATRTRAAPYRRNPANLEGLIS
jgi:hypothetical protein